MSGVMHLAYQREVITISQYLIVNVIVSSKIQWQGTLDYLLCRGWVRKNCHGDLPVELWDSEKTLFHSNILLRGSLGAAGSRLSPRLGQWFVSKGLYVHEQSFVLVSWDSKFDMLLSTCQGSVVARNLSTLRSSQWGWGRHNELPNRNAVGGWRFFLLLRDDAVYSC